MEQAARDKARAEQEKTEYEVRTVDYCFIVIATLILVPFRIRMLAVVTARMMTSRASVDATTQGQRFWPTLLALGGIVHLGPGSSFYPVLSDLSIF